MRRRNITKSICIATVALVPALAMGQATTPTARTITLSNQCPFTVFPGATSGAVSADPPTFCVKGTCGTGQVCNTANNQCYWKQFTTTNGKSLDAYSLSLTSGSTVQVTIPILSTGKADTVWSGNLWVGTDIDSGPSRTAGTVATGYCGKSENGMFNIVACDEFTGPVNTPLTKAEFAFVNSTDFYDISLIHGANVPMSMEPTSSQNLGPLPSSNDPNVKYYWCTAPGSVSKAPTAFCNWVFSLPTNQVTKPGPGFALVQHQQMPTLCGDPKQTCSSGQVCGLAFDPSKLGTSGLYQECGNNSDRGGTWSAIQICTAIDYNKNNLNSNRVSQQFINSLDCGSGPASAGNAQLFQCAGPNKQSCYKQVATAECCGCPIWPSDYKPSGGNFDPKNPNTDRCYSTNPNWTRVSFPWLSYIKQACPAAYSYQFDDVTSTFTCTTVPNTTINATNYTITFCPNHRTASVLQ